MKYKYFLLSFFPCPFSLKALAFLHPLHPHLLACQFLFLFSPKRTASVLNIFLINIYHLWKNMLTHQLSLKESICEKNFLQLIYIKIAVAPISFLAVSNSLILVNYKKCIFRILQILFNSWFYNLLLWNILSFIHKQQNQCCGCNQLVGHNSV